LNLANETTVSIDNLMNKVEEIPISSIEGIRIFILAVGVFPDFLTNVLGIQAYKLKKA